MNSFLFSAFAFCVAAQCALAQYQSTPAYGSGYQQQRKMAPSPQTYSQPQQQQQAYGSTNEYEQAAVSSYEPQQQAPAYRAPAASSYEDRQPAYSKQAAAPAYGKQQASYAAPAAYAKPAPKYEEPYYPPMPFAWGYDINDGYGGAQYHKENGDEYGKRTGSYGYTDAYGIYRQVDYVADEHGFRATIKTNEPGTANESPADVELHAYEPPSNYYAGNKDSYSAAPAKAAAYQAPAASSYAPQQPSYSAPAKMSAYQAPAAAAPQRYNQKQQQQSYSAPRASTYEPSQYSSSSVIVPVYQKAAVAPVAANAQAKASAGKRY